MNTARPRTWRLWLLAAMLAAAGVLLLYPPAGSGDDPAAIGSPQGTSRTPDRPAGELASVFQPESEAETSAPEPAKPTPPAGEPGPWLAAATEYANALTARVESHPEWVAGLEPWVTPHLVEQYELTDPARRPRGAVENVETITPGDYSAHVKVSYDTGLVLKVRVANGPRGWRVTYAEPVSGL